MIYACDFENGMCSYTQNTMDNADWELKSGPASNDLSGPQNGDHTYGTEFGHYMYSGSTFVEILTHIHCFRMPSF